MTSGLGDHANSDEFRPAVEGRRARSIRLGGSSGEDHDIQVALVHPLLAMASTDVDMGDDV
jgi:hypothetical protein